jgi:FtsP/CotA-like multicopper oxidase with cupredoxin domain
MKNDRPAGKDAIMKMRLHCRISVAKAIVSMLFLIPARGTLTAQEITHSGHQAKVPAKIADIVRDPSDVPPGVGNRQPGVVRIALTAVEVAGTLDPAAGTTYRYWTFNGKVPGPMVRVRQGDTWVYVSKVTRLEA